MVYFLSSMYITKPLLKGAFFGVLCALVLYPISPSTAEEFNPDYVISDKDLQDYESMGRGEIQAFLLNKKSFLATYIAQDTKGKNKRAADIIYDASREYKISPKFILVLLQKEMSVVLDQDPTERQLDFAAGYAVCDSCSFSDEKVLKYKGFGKQVDAAAGIMRWYYDNVKSQTWIKQPYTTYSIDGIAVSPANYATGFLYTYTPHIEGNKNFWKLWQQWFKQIYPDGTLIKALNDPSVYFIQEGKRRHITSMSALISRFDPRSIVEVPYAELTRYELGAPLAFANYSILENKGTYYLIDFDTLRPFESKKVFQSFGYHPDEVIVVSDAEISDYSIGEKITSEDRYPYGRILAIGQNKQLYFVKGTSFAPILDIGIAKTRFPQLSVEKGTPAELEGLEKIPPLTFPDATLVGDEQSGKIFVIENGKRRHITSEAVFSGLGYSFANVWWVDQFVMDIHPLGEAIYLDEPIVANKTDDTTPNSGSVPTATPKEMPVPTPKETTKNTLEIAPSNGKLPLTFPETGKVIVTPAEHTKYETNSIESRLDAYVVADEQGRILAGKNIDVVRPIASLTKLMTAYRLFQEGIDLQKATVYKAEKHKALYHAYRISEGEAVKNDDLLKAMLITSRNTPARMLVSSVEPIEASFISRMNGQAQNWGLSNTYFADTYGYDLRNQSTARDYLRLFVKVLEHATIKTYLGVTSFEYNETFDLDNQPHHSGSHTNLLARRSDLNFKFISSKTGYLNESGYNLAMLVSRKSDGKKFYIITMGEPQYADRDNEVLRLTNWVLTAF